jgi:hypothetical protein
MALAAYSYAKLVVECRHLYMKYQWGSSCNYNYAFTSAVGDQPVLEPLSFSGSAAGAGIPEVSCCMSLSRKASCLLCEEEFSLPEDFDGLNRHLQERHSIVIGKAQEIADLPKYVYTPITF